MNDRIRVDGRGVSTKSEHIFGRMEAGPGSVGALNPDPDPHQSADTEGGAGMHSTDQRRRIAAEYLTRARDDLEKATRTRLHYVQLARQYGLTWADIGTFLGISDTAARTLFNRHGGA